MGQLATALRTTLGALWILGAAGCPKDEPTADRPGDDDDTTVVGGVGRVAGTVFAPNGVGADVVPGARVSLAGGPAVVADAAGRFVLDDVAAGEPVVVTVEGPSPRADGEQDSYGTTELRVTVPPDGTAVVSPHLLPGCRAVIDGGAGGTSTFDRCAGAGGVTVSFPAGAFADGAGAPFTGAVRVELTAADPAHRADLAAFPDDGAGPSGPTILGAAEVRLFDAISDAPLELRAGVSADLRFEIAAPPPELEGEPVTLESWDPSTGAWVAEGTADVVVEGERRFLEATVDHFSTWRGVSCCWAPPETCLQVVPRICDSTGDCVPCEPGQCTVDIVDLLAGRTTRAVALQPNDLTGVACVRVRENRLFHMIFQWFDPVAGRSATTRRLVWSASCVEAPGGSECGVGIESTCTPTTCTSLCDPTDRGGSCPVDLYQVAYGCVTGSLLTASGDPVVGEVDVVIAGETVGSFELPEPGVCEAGASVCAADDLGCASSFCGQVPIGITPPGLQLEIRDRVGNRAAFDPPASGAGTCPADRPAACGVAAPGCVDLGELAAICEEISDPLPHGCMLARFTAAVSRDPLVCPDPALPFRVALDASSSTGSIAYYEWFVDGVFTAARDVSEPTLDVCVAGGSHVVRLETVALDRSLHRIRGRAEQVVVAADGPCAATVIGGDGWRADCVYSGATRDCDTDLPGFPDTITTYAQAPCGYPCFTGFTSDLQLAFEPVALPVVEIDFKGAAARQTFELDGYGNWTSVTAHDVYGNPVSTTTYTYDDPAQPTTVQVNGWPGVWNLTWADGRLESFETYLGLSRVRLTYVRDANGDLERVEAWDVGYGAPLTPWVLTPGDPYVVNGSLTGATAPYQATYDFTCP